MIKSMHESLKQLTQAINNNDIKLSSKLVKQLNKSGMDVYTIYVLINENVNISKKQLYILLTNI